jgi:hypothetical protein
MHIIGMVISYKMSGILLKLNRKLESYNTFAHITKEL